MSSILGACDALTLAHRYRYRMVVEVQTPEGIRTGSAVREIVYHKAFLKLPESAGASASQRGEAVVVALPQGRKLFALLPTNAYEPLQAAFGNDSNETLTAAIHDRRVAELKPIPGRISEQSGFPLIAYFKNIDDPMSIEIIDRDSVKNRFGIGYNLSRVTIQMTGSAVSHDINRYLPWLSKLGGKYIDGKGTGSAKNKGIHTGFFAIGDSE